MPEGEFGLLHRRMPLALQQPDVHLSRQIRCVKIFDHLDRGASIARQRQQIDPFAVQQPIHDDGMA